jgi:hypothetical protein
MHRLATLAFLAAAGTISANAAEICLTCDAPSASYRCVVEQPSEKYKLGADIEQEICTKVLAKQGQHQKCHVTPAPENGQCAGTAKTVSLADFQRLAANANESTYEEGAFEIARRNVHDTWLCVSSMFKDC